MRCEKMGLTRLGATWPFPSPRSPPSALRSRAGPPRHLGRRVARPFREQLAARGAVERRVARELGDERGDALGLVRHPDPAARLGVEHDVLGAPRRARVPRRPRGQLAVAAAPGRSGPRELAPVGLHRLGERERARARCPRRTGASLFGPRFQWPNTNGISITCAAPSMRPRSAPSTLGSSSQSKR